MHLIEEYEDPVNTVTKVYRITRDEWESMGSRARNKRENIAKDFFRKEPLAGSFLLQKQVAQRLLECYNRRSK